MTEEIFDIVNDSDEVIGQRPRKRSPSPQIKTSAVHVLVFNARGELFLQKRSMKKIVTRRLGLVGVRSSRLRRKL